VVVLSCCLVFTMSIGHILVFVFSAWLRRKF
jgi:hypothetical protein